MQTEYAASNSAPFGIGTIDTAPRAEKLETSSSRGSPCAQPALSGKKRPFLGMSECRYRFPRLVSDTETLCQAPVQRPYIRETPYRSLSRRRGDDRFWHVAPAPTRPGRQSRAACRDGK